MIPLTHQNKSDHACATLGAGALQPTVLAGRFGIAKVLPRKSCRGSLVPVRRAREYDRNAIFVAAGTSGWIFSYHARPRSGAACGAGFSRAAGPGGSRPAAHLGAIGADALGGSGRWRDRKPLPEMSHFGAEFFRMLRKSGRRR